MKRLIVITAGILFTIALSSMSQAEEEKPGQVFVPKPGSGAIRTDVGLPIPVGPVTIKPSVEISTPVPPVAPAPQIDQVGVKVFIPFNTK